MAGSAETIWKWQGNQSSSPRAYTHDGSWDKWLNHFDNVTCKWTAEQKLPWLKVRLTGRAQKAFKQLPEEMQADYQEAVKGLCGCFEPESKCVLYYVAEFHTLAKKKSEGWADFGEDLRSCQIKHSPP